jgi:hypothetical protein
MIDCTNTEVLHQKITKRTDLQLIPSEILVYSALA